MAYVQGTVRSVVALFYAWTKIGGVRRSAPFWLSLCYDAVALLFFFFTRMVYVLGVVVKYFFYLLLRCKWVAVGL